MPTLKISKSRGNATSFCASLGGHLVALETPEENDYITNLVFQTGRSIVLSEHGLDLRPKLKNKTLVYS